MACRKERVEKAMFAFCPNCEKETQQKFISEDETINIQGEIIPIHLEYYLCEECGEDFEIPRPDYDPLEAAYDEFRKKKGLL
jgi:YgiT-type zinc finger domain-containing protein